MNGTGGRGRVAHARRSATIADMRRFRPIAPTALRLARAALAHCGGRRPAAIGATTKTIKTT